MLSIHVIEEAETVCGVRGPIRVLGSYAKHRAEESRFFAFQSWSGRLDVHIKTFEKTQDV